MSLHRTHEERHTIIWMTLFGIAIFLTGMGTGVCIYGTVASVKSWNKNRAEDRKLERGANSAIAIRNAA
jgi:hypothetical protein